MNIIWYGQSCFKIQSKDIVLITDPFDKKIGLRPPFGSADIVTISHSLKTIPLLLTALENMK